MGEECKECRLLRTKLACWEDGYKATMAEVCEGSEVGPEKHCPCVHHLRRGVERLRTQLADSVSRETLMATEQERDEAIEYARTVAAYLLREWDGPSEDQLTEDEKAMLLSASNWRHNDTAKGRG